MKQTRLVGIIGSLMLGLLVLSGPAEPALAQQQDGRLVIRYSPTLGINIGLVVRIDGQPAGAFVRGHIFERSLRPGRHQLVVRANGRRFDELETTLNVRPGQTYSFVAKYQASQVMLQPSR